MLLIKTKKYWGFFFGGEKKKKMLNQHYFEKKGNLNKLMIMLLKYSGKYYGYYRNHFKQTKRSFFQAHKKCF